MDGALAQQKFQEITKSQDALINDYEARLKRERD